MHIFRDLVDIDLPSSNNQSNVALGLTSRNEEFYLDTIYVLITFIAAYLLLSFAVIFILVKRSKQNSHYSPIEVLSKDLKQSPPPHSPTVVRKSASRTRVFSGSKSKSRSRSKHKNGSRGPSKTCSTHASENKENNLNSYSSNICCSNGPIDNLTQNGVIIDLEDCCQMTLCDEVIINYLLVWFEYYELVMYTNTLPFWYF